MFEKRIPLDFSGRYFLTYRYTQAETNYLKLKKIDSGYDSLFIRIWVMNMKTSAKSLLCISKSSSSLSWESTFYKLIPDSCAIQHAFPQIADDPINSKPDYYFVDSVLTMSKIIEKTSFNSLLAKDTRFGQQFLQTGITNLIDEPFINEYQSSGNLSITIEMATKEYYRILDYSRLPKQYENIKIAQVWNVLGFLDKYFSLSLTQKE